jgi:hypothetical protein
MYRLNVASSHVHVKISNSVALKNVSLDNVEFLRQCGPVTSWRGSNGITGHVCNIKKTVTRPDARLNIRPSGFRKKDH